MSKIPAFSLISHPKFQILMESLSWGYSYNRRRHLWPDVMKALRYPHTCGHPFFFEWMESSWQSYYSNLKLNSSLRTETLASFSVLPLGKVRSLSTALWSLTHLTALHINDNSLSRIPPDIAKLHNLVYLDLSSNKIRSLPAELGNMVSLRLVAFCHDPEHETCLAFAGCFIYGRGDLTFYVYTYILVFNCEVSLSHSRLYLCVCFWEIIKTASSPC